MLIWRHKGDACLWHYYRDEPVLNANGEIINFPDNGNNSTLFKFKQQIT